MSVEDRESADSPEPQPGQTEPVVTGTLFLMIVLLMVIFGLWIMMYLTLFER